ncbi:MAG: hypothetical protein F6K30_00825 [Cyanothece sp. SIO2G6]|nr:hypothetical protein [Cyanothece sp. SIO2G6]
MSSDITNLTNRNYTLDVGQCLDRGWKISQRYLGGFIGFLLLYALFGILAGLPSLLAEVDAPIPDGIVRLASLYWLLIASVLYAGMSIVALQIVRRRRVYFSDFFSGFHQYLPVLLVTQSVDFLVILGFVFFLIPGLILGALYQLSLPLVLDRGLSFWQAMETSRKIVMSNFFNFLILYLAIAIVNFIGLLLLGVGLLFTIPWSVGMQIAAYELTVGLNMGPTIKRTVRH